ncbi:MAG: acetyl-CoA carboxylase biotin carboxyl carrier protein subunit [Bacteroidetes bacterium]|nr:acetyl-CoA carboxylase biotin carboxyl carrier protein subunit [Bacteroidota bacterium]
MENKVEAAVLENDRYDHKKEEIHENYKSFQINIMGAKYRTLLTGKFENRKKWTPSDNNKVVSHIPGTVVKVFVKKGQKVRTGQRLLTLEAMKMRNVIEVPYTGVIKAVHVKEGQILPKGAIMVEMEFKREKGWKKENLVVEPEL